MQGQRKRIAGVAVELRKGVHCPMSPWAAGASQRNGEG